jgi:hypothetical protein
MLIVALPYDSMLSNYGAIALAISGDPKSTGRINDSTARLARDGLPVFAEGGKVDNPALELLAFVLCNSLHGGRREIASRTTRSDNKTKQKYEPTHSICLGLSLRYPT